MTITQIDDIEKKLFKIQEAIDRLFNPQAYVLGADQSPTQVRKVGVITILYDLEDPRSQPQAHYAVNSADKTKAIAVLQDVASTISIRAR